MFMVVLLPAVEVSFAEVELKRKPFVGSTMFLKSLHKLAEAYREAVPYGTCKVQEFKLTSVKT
ncbi:MAG TPA: hypothetical protein VFG54_07075 [Prolixibacteraceae bacterium]|nr:hypothetical protein [Prolixibacteraceae bacterium]